MARTKTWDDQQTDFSGGLVEEFEPDAFTDRSMAVIKGFVLEDQQTLRSQWGLHRVGQQSGWLAIYPFEGKFSNYLLGLQEDGSLWWTPIPVNRSWQGVITQTWAKFNEVPNNPTYKFLLNNDSANYGEGRQTCVSISSTTADRVVRVFEERAGAGLIQAQLTKQYPVDTPGPDGEVVPTRAVFPAANTGAILGSRLFLGDTFYSADSDEDFSATNKAQNSNGIWYSENDTTIVYALSYLYIGSSVAQIRGMHVLDNKLIVITTAGPEGDGIIQVSGPFTGPALAAAGEQPNSPDTKILRGGVGAPRRTSNRHLNYSAVWPETGTVCLVDRNGGIWSTEGTRTERIDEFGPKAPKVATEVDHVAPLGKHLFVSRDNRLLVLSVLGPASSEDEDSTSAAWTELVTEPGNFGQVECLTPLGEDMYFLQSGQVFRFCTGDTERGHISGQPLTLTLATRTHNSDRRDRLSWLRFGVRLRSGGSGRLTSVTIRPRAALKGGPGYVQYPEDQDVSVYDDKTFNAVLKAGIGQQAEASAELSLTGDLILEEYSWMVTGKDPDR